MSTDCDCDSTHTVQFTPPDIVRRHLASWDGLSGESVEVSQRDPFEYAYQAGCHLLIAAEQGARYEGETEVEGLPRSTLRDLSRKLTFVPAGHRFHGWQKPRVPSRVTYFYLDPRGPTVDPELHFAETEFKPKLFFFDRAIWETAAKLKTQIEGEGINSRQYAEALGVTLLHELVRLNNGSTVREPAARGGLAGWQQKRVADYIDDNLAEDIPLGELAGLVTLSPYHFARAFKRSFATPPHRYHMGRRIERAKVLLADPDLSVTTIASRIGFREGSSLTTAFRKFTGKTPSEYRRSLM
jgi:AraC family transcriptional regulator